MLVLRRDRRDRARRPDKILHKHVLAEGRVAINEARLAAGMPPMGHVAPFFYRTAARDHARARHGNNATRPRAAFFDVVTGSSNIDGSGRRMAQGWRAARGWDPVTGLGTPRFDVLRDAALAVVVHPRKGSGAAS